MDDPKSAVDAAARRSLEAALERVRSEFGRRA